MSIQLHSLLCVPLILLPAISRSPTSAVVDDTLVDVLPLSVGNQWTYGYNAEVSNWPSGNPYENIDDAGAVTYAVDGRSDYPDSTVWQFTVYRDFTRHHILWLQSLDTTYSVRDTSSFQLVESLLAQHQLYRNADPYLIQGDAFSFTRDFTDTTTVCRYRQVGPGDTITFLSWKYPAPSASFRNTFAFKRAVGLIHKYYNSGTVDCVASHTYTLLEWTITSIADRPAFSGPSIITLHQNYPNPFNPTTTISFFTSTRQQITVKVFDLLGREVSTLFDGIATSGYKTLTWNAANLTSGVYFCRLQAGQKVQSKKLLLIK